MIKLSVISLTKAYTDFIMRVYVGKITQPVIAQTVFSQFETDKSKNVK